MVCSVRSLGLHGVSGYLVSAECDLSGGLPAFTVVGLPDAAVNEARERVRAAIKNCGFTFPVSRITVNLAPAHLKKVGTLYDLPMLVGILAAGGQLKLREQSCAFLGELSLSGALRPCAGMLPMALAAKREGIEAIYVPEDNAAEATLAEGPTVYPVRDVAQLVRHLSGEEPILPAAPWRPGSDAVQGPDFDQVKGQEQVKRALEIAAAGGHNILMSGPPGSGKSMLARRLPGILPRMSHREALEATEIHSVMGLTTSEHPLIDARPFRSPHHTVSPMGMAGGGSNPRPGEISLAHNGVLFLDELPEFPKEVLEVLRQPLEDGQVQISRASGTVTYPSRFMLVCAMNPCKCGWYGHPSGRCRCTESEVKKYLSRLSGPLLDRIDIFVEVAALEFEELSQQERSEPSAMVRERVNEARDLQRRRQTAPCNARLERDELDRFCALDESCQRLMKGAFERMGLTARSYDRILRVARTIADLEGSGTIQVPHLAEALQYRPPEYLRR
ncbi:YifB family Mg chelatase-like AAA ATPase [Pseudoflavonifractor phocaeensis]|uniref:YifB family Mg chelatase-like AAA ATPase n=1 Tax=Pseudoflavonifractor phocaeensis TaxID=1870988 RepID=UPI001F2EB8F1|nr:YifB family Mg chelatase-like AAA ATPase [Pseudoflavonifractor phocaeensis]MCF2662160.1 YifB family Mg chelatase-like AAA ATPase [Pseudoflavonifractor phocaeensis]